MLNPQYRIGRIGLLASSLGCLLLASFTAACSGEGPNPEPSTEEEASCSGKGIICNYMGNAESGLGEDGQEPLEVSLYLPQDLTFGPDGKPYVLDWNNHRVRTISDGKVETVIGSGELGDAPDGPALTTSLNHPTHVNFDPEGRLILSAWHNSKITRYDPETEQVKTICGTGARDYGGDGGKADKAVLDLPVATVFDSQDRLVIMDQANQRIRRIENDDTINTILGPNQKFLPVPEGYEQVCGPDPKTEVEVCKLCLSAEAEDAACAPRKPQGFAGDDGPGEDAVMYQPFSQSAPPAGRMDIDKNDTIYFCDTGNHRVRALDADGIVRTVAGSGPEEFDRNFAGGYDGDGGKATEALLQKPTDVAVAASGNLYIADTLNHCIRKVNTTGIISTVAGTCGERGISGNGKKATEALLDRPYGIAFDEAGNLYIADTHNHLIRVVYGVE